MTHVRRALGPVVLAAVCLAPPAFAQDEQAPPAEDGWGDEDWGDSGDEVGFAAPIAGADSPTVPTKTGPFEAGGRVGLDMAFWLEDRGQHPFAMARPFLDVWAGFRAGIWRGRLSVHNEIDLAIQAQRNDWDAATLRSYGHQVALREAYVGVEAGPIDVVVGRQVYALGEGRLLSSQDVIAPRDLREPATVDLDRLRLPVGMLRVTGTVRANKVLPGEHVFELALVPEAFFGYRSPPKGPYGSLEGLLTGDFGDEVSNLVDVNQVVNDLIVDYDHLQPAFRIDQLQGIARWTYRGRGVDLGVMGGSVLDQRGTLVLPPLEDLVRNANTSVPTELGLDHRRYELVGTYGAGQAGPFLLRWEGTYAFRYPVNAGVVLQSLGLVTRLDVRPEQTGLLSLLFGLSWSGWQGTTLDIDLMKGFTVNAPQDIIFEVDEPAWSARFRKPFFRDRFYVEATAVGWGWTAEHGFLARGVVGVVPTDGLDVFLGAVSYQPGSERGLLLGLDKHDRLFTGVRYAF